MSNAGIPQELAVAPRPADARSGRRTSTDRLRQWATATLALDVLMVTIAPLVVELIRPAAIRPTDRTLSMLLFSALSVGLFASRNLYRPRLRPHFFGDLSAIVTGTAAAAMALIALRELGGGPAYASWTVFYWLIATSLVATGRLGLAGGQAVARRGGELERPTLIVGAGKLGHLVASRLLEQPRLGLLPIGFLDKEPLDVGASSVALPVLGASWDLDRIIRKHGVEHVIVTFSTAPHHVLLALARRCHELGVSVSLVPRLFELEGKRASVEHLGGLPLVSLGFADPRGWQFSLKYGVERAVGVIALVLAGPFMLAVAAAIRVSMGGPVLYRQMRVGRDGRKFEIFKFRTMRGDPAKLGEADEDWALEQLGLQPEEARGKESARLAVEADDRRTRLGRLLRRFSLDELPQLLNVARGDMAIIGPRPERSSYVERFEGTIYRYADRHRVKSGITGWAQVNGLRGKTSLPDRVEWDNFYVENWSPWLDLKIVVQTVWCVLSGEHEQAKPPFP